MNHDKRQAAAAERESKKKINEKFQGSHPDGRTYQLEINSLEPG
jgi:hypothetical protein